MKCKDKKYEEDCENVLTDIWFFFTGRRIFQKCPKCNKAFNKFIKENATTTRCPCCKEIIEVFSTRH